MYITRRYCTRNDVSLHNTKIQGRKLITKIQFNSQFTFENTIESPTNDDHEDAHKDHEEDEISDESAKKLRHLSMQEMFPRLNKDKIINMIGQGE